MSWPRDIEVVVKQDLASWRNFNSSEDPTRESFLSETNFLVSKLRRNTSLPCLSYYPNPSVIPSITQLKKWRLEPSRWQVHKCLFQNKATLTYGGREGSLLAALSTSPGRGSTIHVTIAKSLGGQRLRTGKKFNWNTSLNAKTTVCTWCLLALVPPSISSSIVADPV